MAHPHVRFRLSTDLVRVVTPGGLIGRLATATVSIPDPRISEAHALVSLRGDCFHLVALRGRLLVDGQAHSELVLAPGMTIDLAEGLSLVVEHIELPADVLRVRTDVGAFELFAETHSLVEDDGLVLVPGYTPGALAWIACTSEGWILRPAEGRTETLRAGAARTFAGQRLSIESVPRGLGVTPTLKRSEVLEIVVYPQTVNLHRPDRPAVVLNGQPAQLVSRLAAADGFIVSWKEMAVSLWPRAANDPYEKRRNLDDVLRRLRQVWQQSELRADLVVCTGDGNIQLLLYPGDSVRAG